MIGTQYRYTPKWEPSKAGEAISQPFQQLAGDVRTQQAERAKARKAAMDARNKQYASLFRVAKGYDGWTDQTIKEYQRQVKQSIDKIKEAADQQSANQITANEILRLEALYSRGDLNARPMVGVNSDFDKYVGILEGTTDWRVKGTRPVVSQQDLDKKMYTFENSTINLRDEMIGGHVQAVGDYVSPKGRLIREEVEENLRSQGIEFTEFTGEDGVTYIAPADRTLKPKAVAGPMFLNPSFGNPQFFSPESVPLRISPTEFGNLSAVNNVFSKVNQRYKDETNPISYDEAVSRSRDSIETLFDNDEDGVHIMSAMDLYENTYGVKFDPSDFIPNEKGESTASAAGRKNPKDLYIDKVMTIAPFSKQVDKGAGAGRGTTYDQYQQTKARSTVREGLPSDLAPYSRAGELSYAGERLYSENLDMMEELANDKYLEISIPGEDLRAEDGKIYSSVIAYPDAMDGRGVIAIRLRDDVTQGKTNVMGANIPVENRYDEDIFGMAFDKQPMPRYKFIIMQNEDGSMTSEYERLNVDFAKRFDRDPAMPKLPVEAIIDSKY